MYSIYSICVHPCAYMSISVCVCGGASQFSARLESPRKELRGDQITGFHDIIHGCCVNPLFENSLSLLFTDFHCPATCRCIPSFSHFPHQLRANLIIARCCSMVFLMIRRCWQAVVVRFSKCATPLCRRHLQVNQDDHCIEGVDGDLPV